MDVQLWDFHLWYSSPTFLNNAHETRFTFRINYSNSHQTYSIRVAYAAIATRLVPPAFAIGTEVDLGPGGEHDLAIFGNVAVGKSKGKRGGSTNDGAGGGVLRSVARAHELVVGG